MMTVSDENTATSDGILVLENLRKEFGGLTAVDNLSIAVEEGEILGFIGPNGAGKSTTFNCVTGTHTPTSGTVRYRGEDVTGEPAYEMVKRGMARTFQSFRPLNDRTVRENSSSRNFSFRDYVADAHRATESERVGSAIESTVSDDSTRRSLRSTPRALATDCSPRGCGERVVSCCDEGVMVCVLAVGSRVVVGYSGGGRWATRRLRGVRGCGWVRSWSRRSGLRRGRRCGIGRGRVGFGDGAGRTLVRFGSSRGSVNAGRGSVD